MLNLIVYLQYISIVLHIVFAADSKFLYLKREWRAFLSQWMEQLKAVVQTDNLLLMVQSSAALC